ncbi:MAG: hypothetical protein GY940_29310, partial [bacterium]|nr:hypothetical protein [bacterium]
SNQGSASVSLDDDVFGGVFRFRRDVGKGSTVGVLYTGKSNSDYYNHLVGADGFFRFSKTKTLSIQYLHSSTRYPDSVSDVFNQERGGFEGDAVKAEFTHQGRGGWYRFEFEDRSPGFRADFGFIPRVDTRRFTGTVHPVIWGKKGQWFDRLAFMLRAERVTDHDNNLTDELIQLAFAYNGPLQSYFQPNVNFEKEFFAGVLYRKTVGEVYSEIKPKGGVSYFIYSMFGDAVDYSNARLADAFLVNMGLELGIGKHLNLNIDHFFQGLSLQGEKIFTANLFQTGAIY